MGRIFGTDGVRGIANSELTAQLAFKLGQAGAKVLTKNCSGAPKILVGKDTRASGDMLEASLNAGFCTMGAQVYCVGVLPTPAVAYLIRKYNMDAGVVISASHNPMEYNGIKFFSSEGYKLSDELEAEIEEYVLDGKDLGELPVGKDVGRVHTKRSGMQDYVDYIRSTVDGDFSNLKIALDCANGASFECAKLLFDSLGAKAEYICNTPDGCNINDGCGSTHTQKLSEYVKNGGFDLGLAFDGDADRLLAVDENGTLVDGDKIMAICALELRKQGKLKKDTVVATVMSNLGFFNALKANGIKYEQTTVGDRYVLENMLANGYCIGGEQSGHIIFLDYNTTGDGLMTAVRLTCALRDSGKKMSDLASVVEILPQVLVNARIKNENKNTYMENKEIADAIRKIEEKFAGNGRVLIRPSGTEPLVRVMLEGKDKSEIKEEATALAKMIEERLG
mgnify:FL=1